MTSFHYVNNLCVCVSRCHAKFFATPWTVAHQASLSMEFSRQEYWSGSPIPSPYDLTDLGIEPGSLALLLSIYPLNAKTLLCSYRTHFSLKNHFILPCVIVSWACISLFYQSIHLGQKTRFNCFWSPHNSQHR